jgi:hypothetical protein
MGRSGDDRGEMTTAADDSAAEEAFEAYLAGRSVAAEGAHLAAFAGAVRATAHEPGRPNAALAELLATGLLVDQPLPSARTAKRRRRPMWFFTTILAKIASAGAVAQAAAGAGIVLVGFTGAGAAGALPDPVQHTFATVVATVTPLTAPDRSGSTGTATTEPVTTTPPATPTTESADPAGTAVSDPATAPTSAPKNFGQKVSEYAKNGGVDGHQVSSWAHARKSGSEATGAPETAAPTTEGSDDDSAHPSGHGNSGGEDGHGRG